MLNIFHSCVVCGRTIIYTMEQSKRQAIITCGCGSKFKLREGEGLVVYTTVTNTGPSNAQIHDELQKAQQHNIDFHSRSDQQEATSQI